MEESDGPSSATALASFAAYVASASDPDTLTYDQAIRDVDAEEWKVQMNKEITSLIAQLRKEHGKSSGGAMLEHKFYLALGLSEENEILMGLSKGLRPDGASVVTYSLLLRTLMRRSYSGPLFGWYCTSPCSSICRHAALISVMPLSKPR